MLNLIRATAGVRRSKFSIFALAIALYCAGILFASSQSRAFAGSKKPHCLKGYLCKMMNTNLKR